MARLKAGEIVQSINKKAYRIEAYLGEGVTATVYRATTMKSGATVADSTPLSEQVVALKVLKKGLPTPVEASFRQEADILREFADAERRVADGLANIPRVIESSFDDKAAPVRFIAMEYIAGESILEILERQGSKPLEEQWVLEVAQQVLRVLHLLHTELHRSYTDFQLRNIEWLAESKTVKVMDWNHVSIAVSGEPPGVGDDLIRFGAYLYQMLTGKGASQKGEMVQTLVNRAGEERWHALSEGTRYLLLQALHPNPDKRFKTAADFRGRVQRQQACWTMDEEELFDEAMAAVRFLKGDHSARTDPEQLRKTEELVDILARRRPDDTTAQLLKQDIDEMTQKVSADWGTGWQYYKAGIFSEAVRVWTEEARRWKERPDLWRWVMLARYTQSDRPPEEADRERLDTLVKSMNREEWPKVDDPTLRSGGTVRFLQHEVRIHDEVANARAATESRKWGEAAAAYKRAAVLFNELKRVEADYATALTAAYGWDQLAEQAAEYHKRETQETADRAKAKDFRQELAKDFENALAKLTDALQADPENGAYLTAAANEVGDSQRDPQERYMLYQVIRAYGRLSAPVESELHSRAQMARAERAEEKEEWDELLHALAAVPDAEIPEHLTKKLQKRFAQAIRQNSLEAAEKIDSALDKADPKGAELREQQIAAALHNAERLQAIAVNVDMAQEERQKAEPDYSLIKEMLAALYREMDALKADSSLPPWAKIQLNELREAADRERKLVDATRNPSPEDESLLTRLRKWFSGGPGILLASLIGAGFMFILLGLVGWQQPEFVAGLLPLPSPTPMPTVEPSPEITTPPTSTLEPTKEATAIPTDIPTPPPTEPPPPTPVPPIPLTFELINNPSTANPNAPPGLMTGYYDLPDMRLSAPPDWHFDGCGEHLHLVDAQQNWLLLLKYKGTSAESQQPITGESLVSAVQLSAEPTASPQTADTAAETTSTPTPTPTAESGTSEPPISYAPGTACSGFSTVDIKWGLLRDSKPLAPGTYSVYWQLVSESGEQRNSEPRPLTVGKWPEVEIEAGKSYRRSPLLAINEVIARADQDTSPLRVVALGKTVIGNDQFLLIRLPRSRETYWLWANHGTSVTVNEAGETIEMDQLIEQLSPVDPDS